MTLPLLVEGARNNGWVKLMVMGRDGQVDVVAQLVDFKVARAVPSAAMRPDKDASSCATSGWPLPQARSCCWDWRPPTFTRRLRPLRAAGRSRRLPFTAAPNACVRTDFMGEPFRVNRRLAVIENGRVPAWKSTPWK